MFEDEKEPNNCKTHYREYKQTNIEALALVNIQN
jgi:hypothetical protein